MARAETERGDPDGPGGPTFIDWMLDLLFGG